MILRVATPDEVALILNWAAAEGWNPGLSDAAAFHAADPEGFFVAEVEGQPVAAVSVVNHDAAQAFLGLYLCRPEYRGRGLGWALWRHGLAHAGGGTVGVDGVAAQEANYARSGFVRHGATRRWEGVLAPTPSPGIRLAGRGDGTALVALDRAAVGHDRAAFLAAWLAPAPDRTPVVEAAGGGFATARRCRHGAKIGPVIAAEAGAALSLARAALAALYPATGAPVPVALDLPEANAPLTEAVRRLGFTNSFTAARMYKGPAPLAGPCL